MLKYKKFIEAIRWYGAITIGLFMGFTGNIVVGLALALKNNDVLKPLNSSNAWVKLI